MALHSYSTFSLSHIKKKRRNEDGRRHLLQFCHVVSERISHQEQQGIIIILTSKEVITLSSNSIPVWCLLKPPPLFLPSCFLHRLTSATYGRKMKYSYTLRNVFAFALLADCCWCNLIEFYAGFALTSIQANNIFSFRVCVFVCALF